MTTPILAAIKSLPIPQQIALIREVVEGGDFADFHQPDLDQLDLILSNLGADAKEALRAEDRAMFGGEVA